MYNCFLCYNSGTASSSSCSTGKESETKQTNLRKNKRKYVKINPYQRSKLMKKYKKSPYITKDEREQLSKDTGLSDISISVWFNNQRSKEKRNPGSTIQGSSTV